MTYPERQAALERALAELCKLDELIGISVVGIWLPADPDAPLVVTSAVRARKGLDEYEGGGDRFVEELSREVFAERVKERA